jgi:crotonobetainyl-CoA:carnitine CoA-transferase CaiB-like acyl-CoA transferase
MERLKLSPEVVHGINPHLLYVRLSGNGQKPSLIQRQAAHDLNFIASSGLLSKFSPLDYDTIDSIFEEPTKPVMPCSYVGDFCAGSMATFTFILAHLLKQ